MSIEEVMEKVTIELPRPLTLDEAEKLLDYLAKQLPGNINYHPSYFRSIIHESNGEILKQDGTVDISATITSLKEPMAFDSFQFRSSSNDTRDSFKSRSSPNDTSKLSVIMFQLVPGWDLSNYRSEVKQLWDDTRKIVMQYFQE